MDELEPIYKLKLNKLQDHQITLQMVHSISAEACASGVEGFAHNLEARVHVGTRSRAVSSALAQWIRALAQDQRSLHRSCAEAVR